MTEQTSYGLSLGALTKTLSGRTIVDNLDLQVEAGEMVCLLGPSGCGKTTTLRMAAGFIEPDFGVVQIGGVDYGSEPPERRPTAMVFQNYALWPHMTIAQNVGFGLKMRKVPRAEADKRVAEALELVNLTHHARSHPTRVSGGEQQRAALARALVTRPQLLLLDEPLSNLDAKLRVRVREEIRDIQQRLAITTLFVTHDQDEALSVADRIAVMNLGRIEQCAAPHEIYRNPATLFVAEFVGTLNRLDEVTVRPSDGQLLLHTQHAAVPCRRLAGFPDGTTPAAPSGLTVGIRPEEVRLLGPEDADGAPAVVTRVLPRGHFTDVVLDVSGTAVRAYVSDPAPSVGEAVRVIAERALAYRNGALLSTATAVPAFTTQGALS